MSILHAYVSFDADAAKETTYYCYKDGETGPPGEPVPLKELFD